VSRVVVLGATGHIGSFLVPALVRAGHQVVALSRGGREPYHPDPAWDRVERVVADRSEEERAGRFGERVAALGADTVVDLICFTEDSAAGLVAALRPQGAHLVLCGSIWVHGTLTEVPVTEDAPRRPWGDYGIGKARIEELLLAESRRPGGLRCTVLHPGHISGAGWPVINPIGNLDLDVWDRLASGAAVTLPNLGLETLHHVHAADVAQAFRLAVEHPEAAAGESFHVVSDRALTLRGFAESVAAWYGVPAVLEFRPLAEFLAGLDPASAEISAAHVERSHAASIEKARRLLGYEPEYTSLAAVAEAVQWLARQGRITAGVP
jgi:nucleoside-diphosphate-sugar epimerase